MVKVRLQGPADEVKSFKAKIEADKGFVVLSSSEHLENKGTRTHKRLYMDVTETKYQAV